MNEFDEDQWLRQIRETFVKESEEEIPVQVSIFSVPKNFMVSNPECYVPQQVGLGPYHRCRSELYDMERYKVAAAKRIQRQLQSQDLQYLVDQLTRIEPELRAVYDKFISFKSETLVLMMAIDASFLLEFIQIFVLKEGNKLTRLSSRMSHLLDTAGTKSTHNAILRDMIMLENQIPMFLLKKMLVLQCSSSEVDNKLLPMLNGIFEELSPFKMMEQSRHVQVMEYAHLLDFFYQLIVPKLEAPPSEITDQTEVKKPVTEREAGGFSESSSVKRLILEVWKTISKLRKGPVRLIKRIIFSKPMKVFASLPWKNIFKIPVVRAIAQPIEHLYATADIEEGKPEAETSASNINKPPLVEEITIPSVSQLSNVGVKFFPSKGGLLSIAFHHNTASFYLPIVSLDTNSEVVLRNLVAYEACNVSGQVFFARYTELMNGIIDTEEDAKLLRERGIILNRMKSDQEVANLWNGMTRSARLTKVPHLDKVIENVNKHYNGKWKVKIEIFMKNYVYESWQFLTFLATILLLLLMSFQAFCSVYNCTRIFHVKFA